MKLIVGLGNPGEKYIHTRHNLGFMVVEQLLKDVTPVEKTIWSEEKKFKSEIAVFDWKSKEGKGEKVVLVKPKTYMNNSGFAVSLLASFYKVLPEDIWIIHDELDLPFGSIKIRNGGAAAGHHGVESVIASLNNDKFWRFRLGIGINAKPPQRSMGEDEGIEREIAKRKVHNVEDYVLGVFSSQEQGRVKEIIRQSAKAIQTALEKDIKAAQNQFNTK